MTRIRKVANAVQQARFTGGAIVYGAKDRLLGTLENAVSPKTLLNLALFDTSFPSLTSSFRIAEFNAYLEQWSNALVYSRGDTPPSLGLSEHFKARIGSYEQLFPHLSNRVRAYNPWLNIQARLAYTVFLYEAGLFIEAVERSSLPFVFTLYPGGRFKLEDTTSDNQLKRIFASTSFRKVIATQPITRDYLIQKQFCQAEDIAFIPGVVLPTAQILAQSLPKKYYGQDKATFDICFVAHKYMPGGIDKGYDRFIEVAHQLAKKYDSIAFHVIGGFNETDVDVRAIRSRIKFYGSKKTEEFPPLYAGMDILLSPNRPFKLSPGAFDGFPLGTNCEAGLHGVAIFCTDALKQNVNYKDGEEIVIIPDDLDQIVALISDYYESPDKLYRLAAKGQEAFKRNVSFEAQMIPRIQLLSACMEKSAS